MANRKKPKGTKNARVAAKRAERLRNTGPDASGNFGVNPWSARGHVVEVAPAYDPTGITGFLAAQLLMNFLGFIFEARHQRMMLALPPREAIRSGATVTGRRISRIANGSICGNASGMSAAGFLNWRKPAISSSTISAMNRC